MTPAILALAVAVAAPAAKDPPKTDVTTIVGEWDAESAMSRGKPDNPPPGTTWTFTAEGKSVLRIGGRDEPKDGTYKADPKKDPAEVDITDGPKGRPMRGIYKVEGDTLTLCLSGDDEDRPKAFDAPAGSRVILIILKRAKKKD